MRGVRYPREVSCIRDETPADVTVIEQVTVAAFRDAPHTSHKRAAVDAFHAQA
jgi:hypothetical protein